MDLHHSLSQAGGVGTGASFTSNQVTFTNDSSHTDIRNSLNAALSAAGSGYNGKANVILIPTGGATGVGARITVTRNSAGGITGFSVSGTITTAYNGTFTATIEDRKGYIDVNGNAVNTSTTRFRNDEEFIAVAKSNLLAPVCPYLDSGTTRDNAIGKNIYLSSFITTEHLERDLRQHALPCTGNFCSPVVNVDAIPGSNVKFLL